MTSANELDDPSLEHLVAPLRPATFCAEHWAPGRPYLSQANPGLVSRLKAIAELTDVEALLARHDSDVSLFGPNGFRSTVPARRAADFLHAGYNLYITQVERTVPEAKALFAGVVQELGIPPWQVHLEAFAGEGGGVSSRHYDHDINLQILLDGTKEWTLEENRSIQNPLAPFHPRKDRHGHLVGFTEEAYATGGPVPTSFDPARSQTLRAEAGTTLFVPRGYWHETRSLTRTWGINLVIKGESWGSAFGAIVADVLNQHDARFRAFCNGVSFREHAESHDETAQAELFEEVKRVALDRLTEISMDDVFLSQMSRESYSWTASAARREVVERDGGWALVVPDVCDEPVELSRDAAAAVEKLCVFRHPFSWKHARYSPPEIRGVVLCRTLARLIGLGALTNKAV